MHVAGGQGGQGRGSGCGRGNGKPHVFEPGLERFTQNFFVVDHQDVKVFPIGRRQRDRIAWAGRLARPAAGAGDHIDHVGIGHLVGHRQIDRLAPPQAGVKGVGNLDRTDRHAGPAADAALRIDPGGLLAQRDGKTARLAIQTGHPGAEQNLDVLVEQPLAQAELAAGVALHQRQHPAHAAVVGGKLVVELAENPADMRRLIDHGDPVTGFGQVQGGANAADPRADDQGISDFAFHGEVLQENLKFRMTKF